MKKSILAVTLMISAITLGTAFVLLFNIVNTFGINAVFAPVSSMRHTISTWTCYSTFRNVFPLAILCGLTITACGIIQNEMEPEYC